MITEDYKDYIDEKFGDIFKVLEQHNEVLGLLNVKRKQHGDTLKQFGYMCNEVTQQLKGYRKLIEQQEAKIQELETLVHSQSYMPTLPKIKKN